MNYCCVELISLFFVLTIFLIRNQLTWEELEGDIDLLIILEVPLEPFEADDNNLIGFVDLHLFNCSLVLIATIATHGVVSPHLLFLFEGIQTFF